MPLFDLPAGDLRVYETSVTPPEDLDAFWSATLLDARSLASRPSFSPVDSGLTVLDSFDVTFSGFGGQDIKGWLHVPAGARGPLPAVVEYVGYGGGRGLPHERVLWALAGYAHLVMDTRGQGGNWGVGDTPDAGSSGSNAHPGFLTRGIDAPADYYYRRLFTDSVLAVDAAAQHPLVDADRIAVAGGSQGGGMTIAVAALHDAVRFALPDVPFLSDFPRAITITSSDPYGEIQRFLKTRRHDVEQVLATLAYFDVAVLGRTATAPALFSVGLMDETCPPSTVYAAFNGYGGPKEIVEYPFNDHEGGAGFHDIAKIRWLNDAWATLG